jgi:hypothetical protein
VAADGTGLSSRAGTVLLALTAQRLGLTDGLSGALAATRERRSSHDPGRVLCDLAVMAADGGRCVSDLAALAGQPALFGNLASVSTARRVLLAIGQAEIDRIRMARALARERAWRAGAAPGRVILDFDATPISIHSEKEQAAGHYKGGFGFNPLLVSCGREVLSGVLRPANAGANNACDHLKMLELARGRGVPGGWRSMPRDAALVRSRNGNRRDPARARGRASRQRLHPLEREDRQRSRARTLVIRASELPQVHVAEHLEIRVVAHPRQERHAIRRGNGRPDGGALPVALRAESRASSNSTATRGLLVSDLNPQAQPGRRCSSSVSSSR